MVHVVSPRASRPRARAFTLIELMITVAIVGVLAVVAYAAYHKFVASSHQTEANAVLAGIKNRQEAYKAATGSYMNISNEITSGNWDGKSTPDINVLYPHCAAGATPGAFNVQWPVPTSGGAACPAGCCPGGGDWLRLGVQVTAPTFYGYSSTAGGAGSTPVLTFNVGSGGNNILANVNGVSPWFAATAVGDTDGNSVFTSSLISSFDNDIHIEMDGE